jgi:hypothetical protein
MARSMGFPLKEGVSDRLELEQDLLEPELVGLVDDDEQKLIVGGGLREQALNRQKVGEPEIGAVGEFPILLAEPRAREVLVADVAPPARAEGSLPVRLGAYPARRRVTRPAAYKVAREWPRPKFLRRPLAPGSGP